MTRIVLGDGSRSFVTELLIISVVATLRYSSVLFFCRLLDGASGCMSVSAGRMLLANLALRLGGTEQVLPQRPEKA